MLSLVCHVFLLCVPPWLLSFSGCLHTAEKVSLRPDRKWMSYWFFSSLIIQSLGPDNHWGRSITSGWVPQRDKKKRLYIVFFIFYYFSPFAHFAQTSSSIHRAEADARLSHLIAWLRWSRWHRPESGCWAAPCWCVSCWSSDLCLFFISTWLKTFLWNSPFLSFEPAIIYLFFLTCVPAASSSMRSPLPASVQCSNTPHISIAAGKWNCVDGTWNGIFLPRRAMVLHWTPTVCPAPPCPRPPPDHTGSSQWDSELKF